MIDGLSNFLLTHSPALIVAVPLLGAFLTPLISKVNDKARNIFAILVLGFTAFLFSILHGISLQQVVFTLMFLVLKI